MKLAKTDVLVLNLLQYSTPQSERFFELLVLFPKIWGKELLAFTAVLLDQLKLIWLLLMAVLLYLGLYLVYIYGEHCKKKEVPFVKKDYTIAYWRWVF